MHIYVSDIGALDDLLVRIHVSRQRPSYRRRLLEGIDALDGIGGLRVLRAIARQLQLRDRVSVGDIAVDMGIGQSSASRAVDDVCRRGLARDRKSTRLNSSHVATSYAVFCLKKKRQDAGS